MKPRHTSTSIIIRNTKTGKQNMNHSTKSVFVIQNLVSASPSEGYKAGPDTFSIDIPSLMCPYDGAESHLRIGRDIIESVSPTFVTKMHQYALQRTERKNLA